MSLRLISFWAEENEINYLKSLPNRTKSEYIREALREKREKEENPGEILKKAEELEGKANDLRDEAEIQKTNLINKRKKITTNLSDAEIVFLNNSLKILEERPTFIGGRLKYYNSFFGKKIQLKTFQALLDDLIVPERLKNQVWEECQ